MQDGPPYREHNDFPDVKIVWGQTFTFEIGCTQCGSSLQRTVRGEGKCSHCRAYYQPGDECAFVPVKVLRAFDHGRKAALNLVRRNDEVRAIEHNAAVAHGAQKADRELDGERTTNETLTAMVESLTAERDAALARANAAEARVKELEDMRRGLEDTIMGMGAESSTRADVIRGLRAQLDAHKRALDEALFSGDARRAAEDSDTHVWRNHIRAIAGGSRG